MNRHFRALRHITLPRDLVAGPGATNMRLDPGAAVTCDADACARNQRFINGRKREGDLEELENAPADAPAAKPVPSDSSGAKLGHVIAAPKKER